MDMAEVQGLIEALKQPENSSVPVAKNLPHIIQTIGSGDPITTLDIIRFVFNPQTEESDNACKALDDAGFYEHVLGMRSAAAGYNGIAEQKRLNKEAAAQVVVRKMVRIFEEKLLLADAGNVSLYPPHWSQEERWEGLAGKFAHFFASVRHWVICHGVRIEPKLEIKG